MSRPKATPASKTKTKNVATSSFLPDDQEIANRYVVWKNLLDKYNRPGMNDEDGFALEDVLQMYGKDDEEGEYAAKNIHRGDEALECSEDDDENISSSRRAREYEEMKNKYTNELQERSERWKSNGMERIINSDFSLSADSVLRWVESAAAGTGKQVTHERETHFTEFNDNTQMDVTRRENVSILNESNRKQVMAENSSNYAFTDNSRRRVIVRHVEKRTVSSYVTIESPQSNTTIPPHLEMGTLLQSLPAFTPFKQPYPVASCRLPNACLTELVNVVPKSCIKNVPKNQTQPAVQRKVSFKPAKRKKCQRMRIESSDSSENEDENYTPVSSSRSNSSRSNSTSKKKTVPSCKNTSSVSKQPTGDENPVNMKLYPVVCLKNCADEQKVRSSEPKPQRKEAASCEYPMPENYRQFHTVNGRCPNSAGIVIYRPKPMHRTLPKEAEQICIRRQDLDLSGIESMAKREKFANFCRLAPPNATLVYYMSESEDEADAPDADDEHDVSWDDDDPILTYKPPCVLTFLNNEMKTS